MYWLQSTGIMYPGDLLATNVLTTHMQLIGQFIGIAKIPLWGMKIFLLGFFD